MSELNLIPTEQALKLLTEIGAVEKEFLKHEQVPCPVVHSFGPGVYLRQVTVPAGSFVIGHHQNFEQMNVFLKGKVSMLADDGNIKTISAPMTFTGKPGRKIGYVHEDMVWINVYSTDETDVEKLEAHFLTKSDGWLEDVKLKEGLTLLQSQMDRDDFKVCIAELGFTEVQVRTQSENQDDMTELPFASYKFKVADSKIEGRGLFATADILAGENIALARLYDKRTVAGRFTNHSISPNARMIRSGPHIYLVALKNISGCHGGLDGEEITINYRDAVKLNLQIRQEDSCQV